MTFFVPPPGVDADDRPIDARDFIEVLDCHVTFAERIAAESEPGPYGIDVERAMRDAKAIKKHRESVECVLLMLLRLWEPEFEILN